MTNQYDGPAFLREQDTQPLKTDPQNRPTIGGTLDRPYVPPVLHNHKFATKVNYRQIEQQLTKRARDYFVVIDEEHVVQQTVGLGSEPSVSANSKESVKRTPKSALGHSLSDILETESQAQKHLKIFKQD